MMPRQLWGIFHVHSRGEGLGLMRNAGGNIQNNGSGAGWQWGLGGRMRQTGLSLGLSGDPILAGISQAVCRSP